MPDAKLCPQCGRSYSADDRFCTVDGATLVASGTSTSLIGTVLAERYLVRERLGEGGMGEVYLAEHVRMKRKVAVKIMRSWMAGDPTAVSRFHREAENASQITHPNVAQVYDFGESAGGLIYLAMEYVPGESLSQMLDREIRLSPVRAADVVRQIAEALVAAHHLGILHRDLKPDNVLVAKSRGGTDVVKLVDFGIARVMSSGTQQVTSTGMIVGTPEYMSPEQLAGDKLDERSDLYALALIAFRCLTGHGAFPNGASGEALVARLVNQARKLRDVRPEVAWPDPLQAAFDRALRADPAARHADAAAFAIEVEEAVSQMPLNEEELAYLVALARRQVTPIRLGAIGEGATAAYESGTATPPIPRESIALQTPPTEQPPLLPTRQLQVGSLPTPTPPVPVAPTPLSGAGGDDGARQAGAPDEVDEAFSAASSPLGSVGDASITTGVAKGSAHERGGLERADPGSGTAGTRSSTLGAATVSTRDADEGAAGAPRSRRGVLVVAGALAVAAAVAIVLKTRAPASDGERRLTAIAPTIAAGDSTAVVAPPLAADSAGAPADSPVSDGAGANVAAADSARVARARGGVLAVASSARRGTAFVADANLLITAADLATVGQPIDVFLDGDRMVRGQVVYVDSVSRIAAVAASLASCRRCRPVALAGEGASDSVAIGDSVVALTAAARTSAAAPLRTVSAVSAASVGVVPALTGATSLGTPLVRPRTGAVVGVQSRRSGAGAIAGASALRSALRAARTAARAVVPDTTLYWTVPTRAVPEGVLRTAESRAASAFTPMTVTQGGFTVFFMTPQAVWWRAAKSGIAEEAAQENPFAIPSAPRPITDAIAAWGEWRRYHDERRAVVIVEIAPEKAAFPNAPTRVLDVKDGDVFSMELRRGDQLLLPIESQLIPAIASANRGEYTRRNRPIPNAGVYVFHPADFADPTATYQMVILDANRTRRASFALPPAVVQGIAADLGPWQQR